MDNKGVATRKMVDAGVKAYYEYMIEHHITYPPVEQELVVKIYRAMIDAEKVK